MESDAYIEKIKNFREKVKSGNVRGVRVIYGDRASVDLIAQSGMDFIYLDQQHGNITIRDIYEITAMLSRYNTVILVRTPDHLPTSIGLALDAGAHGVLAPDIETVEQAREFVASTRFPPIGVRSWGRFSAGQFGNSSLDDFVNPICWALIESKSAHDQVEKIVRVEGLDGIYVGRFDLALSMAVSLQAIGSDILLNLALKNIMKLAADANLPVGTSGNFSELSIEGFRILTVRSELELLSVGLQKYLKY